jgi:threonine synthase
LTGHQLKDPNATVAYHGTDQTFFEDILGKRGVKTTEFANHPISVANDLEQIVAVL